MNELLIVLIVFLVLMFLGAPIYISMIIPSLIYFVMSETMTTKVILLKMGTSLNSFPLMAIPFFMVAAEIMNNGGITDRIFEAARALVGRLRGGLGYVNILASVIFSGMSGSALADVGGLGQIELKAMREAGYDDEFSIGITAASGTIGPIIPPSIPFVVFGSYVSVSTGALFMGGIIPGVVLALTLSVMTFIYAKKKDYPRDEKRSFKEIFIAIKRGTLSMLMPLIIIGGIWSGKFTATEAAVVSILYAIILSVFVYRYISLRELPGVIMRAVYNVLPILSVVVGATLLSFVINFEKVDAMVLNLLTSITSSKYVVLLLINIIVLILGMFFEAIVAELLLAPILPIICASYGLDMIHVCVIIVLNLMIGLLTPPVGQSLFLLSTVTKRPVTELIGIIVPWLVPLTIALIVITYFEPAVMFLPRLCGFA